MNCSIAIRRLTCTLTLVGLSVPAIAQGPDGRAADPENGPQSVQADTATADAAAARIKALEEEVKRLESEIEALKAQAAAPPQAASAQAQRVHELEERLRILEDALIKSGTISAAAVPTPPPSPAAAAGTQDQQPVPARMDLSSGELREDPHVVTGASLASADFPGSWPMFGTDYRMKFGGYFKGDALYDFNGSGDNKQFLMSGIPVEGTPQASREGYFNMLVNETRFNFDVRKTTKGEPPQKFFLEMDFFDERNNAPRMRHAFVQYGNLIVGQTWSITTEVRAINYMIEWAYGDAIYGTRSKQIRWQQQIDEHWSWAVGIEKLDFPGIDSQGLSGAANSRMPLLAGRATFENRGSFITVGGSVNELRWDGRDQGPDATAAAWNVVLDGRKNLGARDYVTYSVAVGDGAVEGMGAFAGGNYNATLFPDGSLKKNSYVDLNAGYTHKWTDTLFTNLNNAWFNLNSDYDRRPDSLDTGWIAHANLVWKLHPHVLTGGEYIVGNVTNVNGAKGHASRVQAMFRYNF